MKYFIIAVGLIVFDNFSFGQDWWLQEVLQNHPPITSISIANDTVIWASGFSKAVFRSVDGGANWNSVNSPSTNEVFPVVEALNADTAFLGGDGNHGTGNARIYKTTDGGMNWDIVYTANGSACFWDGIQFLDSRNAVALCDPSISGGFFIFVKTTDGGSTWSSFGSPPDANTNEYGYQNSFFFYDSLNGWFGTSQAQDGAAAGRVFRTTNGGMTWTGYSSGNSFTVYSVRFISPTTGIRTSADKPYLTRSTDGGQAWETVDDLPVSNISRIIAATSISKSTITQFWVCGESGSTRFVLTSLDSGATWRQQNLSENPLYTIHNMEAKVTSDDSVLAFAVTHDFNTSTIGGEIISYKRPLGYVTKVDKQILNPGSFKLSQNYPNPFNPTTKIKFSTVPMDLLYQDEGSSVASSLLAGGGMNFVTLKVYDILGNEIATLVNEEKPVGEYEVEFDGSHLSSGIYFYTLSTGEFYQTMKMVLMK